MAVSERDQVRKRLWVDLNSKKTWSETIPVYKSEGIGGRYLNARLFSERFSLKCFTSPPEFPIALSVGPLAGTFAPCSGWTSISSFTPLMEPPEYAHVSLPGHWGPHLKFAGFDQCVILGKSPLPVYLHIEKGMVTFEDARMIWGKSTVDTVRTIQEDKEDRELEILCIGPAGEKGSLVANVINRTSWTADHTALGSVFGGKNLKALVLGRGKPVSFREPKKFLDLCLDLRSHLSRDKTVIRLKEKGTFYFLGKNWGGLGIRNFREISSEAYDALWESLFSLNYAYGQESCFSCPIHCGRVARLDGDCFGGIHLEGAWSLGPQIGLLDWKETLTLYRDCLLQGIDPSSAGSILSGVMDASEKGNQTVEELRWGDAQEARRLIRKLIPGDMRWNLLPGEILHTADERGRDRVLQGKTHWMGLPVRDPRSSPEYAMTLTLFPLEWDYLRSFLPESFRRLDASSGERTDSHAVEEAMKWRQLKVLADMTSMCPLVVADLGLLSVDAISDMTGALLGVVCDPSVFIEGARKTMQMEEALRRQVKDRECLKGSPF